DVEVTWFYGKQAEEILKKTSAKHEDQNEIKGQVANAPVKKIKGKVQVILDVSKKEFKQGNILVTTMTRPEFVPLMRKAKAIITDEGGITCHAAVVAREFKIPAVIGTKVATKKLRDGDMVKVDARIGFVKKVS
ncbi:phosphoenolpyruvate synthase, partial [bacterium]|nr:phosphoenolpyruvate synthase [bacterium]